MRCKDEEFITGAVFHIYNHAIDKYSLFHSDEDYRLFLNILQRKIEKIPASIFAYCLMPNHYHFLIRQDSEKKIYLIFNYAFISYAQIYNKIYGRKGPIFRTPLQHKAVTNQEYLIQLCKYIHMNPVSAGLVDHPEDWAYSNYLEWIKKRNGKLFAQEIHDKYFPEPKEYIEFIESFTNYLPNKTFKKLLIDSPLKT